MTSQTETPLLRVTAIEAKGLFGIYNHNVVLKAKDRITIIHGPNGVGKTVLLGLTTAILTNRMTRFLEVPFSTFSVSFDDGSVLTIDKTQRPVTEKKSKVKQAIPMGLTYRSKNGHEENFEFENVPGSLVEMAEQIADKTSFVVRIDSDHWADGSMEDIVDAEEIVARYSPMIRPHLLKELPQIPEWLKALRQRLNLHFIETQRLFQFSRNSRSHGSPVSANIETVRQYAEELKRRISETLADYGKHAEKLDQTFPQRLLGTATANLDIAELKQKMIEINLKRSKLRDIGLLSESSEGPIAEPNASNDTELRVMTLYVQDTLDKLSVFDELAQCIELLCDIVNHKFQNKQIVIQRDVGLQAMGPNNQPLPLEALSSGEQHEIVLLYNLLFKVKPNTLVLLDEPELSLHVTWQKSFLEDLSKIVALSEFDVVLATHSPYIVGDRSDLMIPLSTEVSQ